MPIDTTNNLTGSQADFFAPQSSAGRTTILPPSDPAASQAIPAEILQIATPSSVSLDPKSIQSLADNISYDALTKASLEAISQVQSGNSQLMKLLGG